MTEIQNANVLPKVNVKVKHHKAMAWQDVPAVYTKPQNRSATAAKALMFTILTAVRTGEVSEAKWEEVDFKARTWTVPAERMKIGVEHRIPLAKPCLPFDPGMALEEIEQFFNDTLLEGKP